MRLNKYFTIAAVALALVACDKNNDDFNIEDTKDTPISIASAGVTELTTRAITNGKLVGATDAPVEIGVFISDGSAEKYNATNVKWSHDGSDWTGATMLYEGVRSNQKIYAYYPYVDATTGSVTVTASEQEDWLVATADDLTSSVVELTMTHALTKLVLKPTFGTELTSQTITSVEVGDMYASGILNVSDNSWSNLPEANTTLEMKNNELLVIPMASCTSFTIVITMSDSRKFTADISLAGVNNKLASGYRYNIALQVGQDKVTLGSITASPWGYATGGVLETE